MNGGEPQRLLDQLREAAEATATEAYLVGGFVRDSLLGRPGKDIDVVCVGNDGLEMLRRVAQARCWAPPVVFERFGTAQIRGNGFILEVVRARAERYDPESRKPSVEPGTLEQDIWRRDFTVNALCRRLGDPTVLDITGRGLEDLREHRLRTPLDPVDTFSEDPLRMFRGARFVAQLGFALDEAALTAMRQVAPRAAILSVERISEEIRRLLVCPHADLGLWVLHRGGLLAAVLPEIEAMAGVEQGGYHDDDVLSHSIRTVAHAPADLRARLAALFHDIGKPVTHQLTSDGRHTFYNHPSVGERIAREVLTRLRFSSDDVEQTGRLVALHMRPIQYRSEGFSDSAVRRLIRDSGPLRAALLDLARADTRASTFPTTAALDELEQRMERLDRGGEISRLRPPLDGHRLQQLAGRPPGPWIGGAMNALVDAVLDGEIEGGDAAAAEAWLRQHPELLRG